MSKKLAILFIDDSPEIREVLRVALESEGYSVLDAADGREGVRLFREHQPAVTIVDIVMPEEDGIETVREILGVDPQAIIFTMWGQEEAGTYQETARILDTKAGFLKPIRLDQTLGAIRHTVRTANARVEKTYNERLRIIVQDHGILIEAVNRHTSLLFLSGPEAQDRAEGGVRSMRQLRLALATLILMPLDALWIMTSAFAVEDRMRGLVNIYHQDARRP